MEDLSELSELSGIPPASFTDAVFNLYAQRLMRVASDRLGAKLRSKVSPEDVVQSAFKSFFRRQGEFQFRQDGSDGLWGLLVVITVRKCTKWADMFGAGKRAADREVLLDVESPLGHKWREAVSREPGPEEVAMLSELVERLMEQLNSRQREIIALRMQGCELNEIAAQLQTSRRTVARVVVVAKDILRELLAPKDD